MIKLSRRKIVEQFVNSFIDGENSRELIDLLRAEIIFSKRQHESELFIKDIYAELERRGKLAFVVVSSKNKLSVKNKNLITNFIKTRCKVEDVVIEEKIDNKLIYGIVIQTSTNKWDFSGLNFIQTIFRSGAKNV